MSNRTELKTKASSKSNGQRDWNVDQFRIAFGEEDPELADAFDAVPIDLGLEGVDLTGVDVEEIKRRAAFNRHIKDKPLSMEDLLAGCLSAEELSETEVPRKRPYLENFMKEADLGFIYSWRDTGKTWLGLDMAGALTEGRTVGPWRSFVKVPVVYIDGEMPAESIQTRMHLLGVTSKRFTLLNHELLSLKLPNGAEINLIDPRTQDSITALCLSKRAKVLFLDNLSTLCSGLKESDNDDWDKIKRWLLHLRRLGIAVIILDHAGKNWEHRGASRKEDNVTWVLNLGSVRKKDDGFVGTKFRSEFEKNRNDPAGYQSINWFYAYDKESHILTPSAEIVDASEQRSTDKKGRPLKHSDDFMLKPLKENTEGLTHDEWWRKLGGHEAIRKSTFDHRLKSLTQAGRIAFEKKTKAYVYQETLEEKAAKINDSVGK